MLFEKIFISCCPNQLKLTTIKNSSRRTNGGTHTHTDDVSRLRKERERTGRKMCVEPSLYPSPSSVCFLHFPLFIHPPPSLLSIHPSFLFSPLVPGGYYYKFLALPLSRFSICLSLSLSPSSSRVCANQSPRSLQTQMTKKKEVKRHL